MRKTILYSIFLSAFVVCCASAPAEDNGLVAFWKFDESRGEVAVDSITGKKDAIKRTFWYLPGVSGTAVKFDGFTTHIVRKAADAPRLMDAFTVEAWVAPQAYPYNWCAIVNQARDEEAGYFFGIDAFARVGLHVAVDGKWRQCNTDKEAVPFMTKWTYIAGTFDKSKGLAVYINGEKTASLPIKGRLTFADEIDLQIGRNHKKTRMDPETLVRREVNFPTSYSFDGLIDEVRIYDRALSADEIRAAYEDTKPDSAPPLKWRKLPEIPAGDGTFGAAYCRLKFYPEWDNLWRVGEHPDIVVNFDGNPYQMVFWRGTNFNMNLVTENGKWVGDQSAEGGGGEVIGCCEHMSDKQCRYAHVRMIENNDARVVVHWRYAVNDVLYRIANMEDGWGAWADEYYYIYPDGVAVRAFTVYNMWGEHSTTEPASYNNPGERAEDNLNVDALIQANMQGQIRRQSWDPWPSNGKIAAPFSNDLPNANINIVNFKSNSKPFYIYEPGTRVIPYGGGLFEVRDYSKFPTWNHWPVGQAPSDGRYAFFADRVSSSAVTSPEPVVEVNEDGTSHGRFIMGLTDKPIEKLALIARSWLQPPELNVKGGIFISEGYSRDERAFTLSKNFSNKPETLNFEITASNEQPIVNPAFVIKNWGHEDAELKVNGKTIQQGKDYRFGHRHTLQGSDLVVWIETESTKTTKITLEPAAD
ncbi:LamG domain-containing protein [Planctomycetota bacterium]